MTQDFDRLVESWLEDTVSTIPDPVHIYPAVAAGIAGRPQHRLSWLHRFDLGRSRSMFSATKFVVAGIVVALFGGLLLAGVLTQKGDESLLPAGASASPEATPSYSFTLPAEIPEGIESGSLDTPLGPAQWVHLQGDHTTMPDYPALLPAPGGYVVLDESPPELWSSPDVFTWTREPLPFHEAEWARLTLANGIYWLSTGDTVTLWRSTDAVDWEQIDATGLVPPGPPGLYQATSLGVPAMSGDTTIAVVDYEPVQFKTYFGLPDERGHTNLEETAPGLYQATSKYGVDLATLRFEETDEGLTVIDAADGSVRIELEGVGLDLIELWTDGERGDMGVVDLWAAEHGLPSRPRQIAYVENDKLVPMDLPASPIGSERPALFGTDAEFFLYTLDPDGLLRVRRSEDGRAWSEAELLGDDEGEPSGVWAVEGQPQSVVAYGDAMEEWRSTDGTTWEVTRERGDPDSSGRLGSSLISFPGQGVVAPNLRFRSDDGEITDVDVSGLSIKRTSEGAGGNGSGVLSDDTLFYAAFEEEGTREHDVWIITFDELPA